MPKPVLKHLACVFQLKNRLFRARETGSEMPTTAPGKGAYA